MKRMPLTFNSAFDAGGRGGGAGGAGGGSAMAYGVSDEPGIPHSGLEMYSQFSGGPAQGNLYGGSMVADAQNSHRRGIGSGVLRA